MITTMRRYFKGIGFQIFMWLAAVSMVIVWVPGVYRRGRGHGNDDGWVAQVNGAQIGAVDFKRSVMNHEAQIQFMRSQYGEYADLFLRAMGLNPTTLAFDSLVRQELLDQAVTACSFNIHPDFAIDMLANPHFIQKWLADVISIADLERAGGIDRRALQVQLRRAGLTNEDFEGLVYKALEREMLVRLIGGAAYVPQFAIKAECNKQFATKKFSVLSCSLDRFYELEKKNPIAAADLKAFYDRRNRESKVYWTPEKRAGITWSFDPKAFDLTIDEKDLERYYNEHLTEFVEQPMQMHVRRILLKVDEKEGRAAAYKKAQGILQEVVQHPDQFAKKAQEFSQDTESAKKGGLLAPFSKGSRDQAFEKAALLLRNDGDISDIFETKDGIEIIQRVSRKQPVYKGLAAVRAQVNEKLRAEKFNDLFRQEVDELFATGTLDEAKLRDFVAKYNGVKASIEVIKGKNTGRIAQTLIALPEGESTYLMDDGRGVIVQLQNVVARQIPSLETVKATVEADLYKERAYKTMVARVQEVKRAINPQSASALAKENGFTFEATDWIRPDNNERVEALKKKGVPVNLFAALEKVASVASQETENGAYIVVLDAIEPVSPAVFVQKENILTRQVLGDYAGMLVNGFVASLYRNATIKTNESLLHTEEDYSV